MKAALTALAPFLFLGLVISPVFAPPEIYVAGSNPRYAQEVGSGVTLQLNVTSAQTFTTYTFTWRVTDPTGTTYTASKSSGSGFTGAFTQTIAFPSGFTGATTNYVGNYSVRIDQTAPSSKTNVASTQFEIGLAATKTIQRTFPLSLKAAGYQNGENVTIDITKSGASLAGFPAFVNANTTQGTALYSWRPPASTPLGSSVLTFRGSSTLKIPADTQVITILPVNVTISSLVLVPSVIQRTQSVEVRFSGAYASGLPVQSGSAVVRIVESDGLTTHFVPASYNSSLGMFRGAYRVGLGGLAGIWNVIVDHNSTDDGYGDVGPPTASSTQLTVQQATLILFITPLSSGYRPGDSISLFATITCPDGSLFNSGTVTATITFAGSQVGSNISFTSFPSPGYWAGTYTIATNDPVGTWVITVYASDPYGNHGQSTASATVQATSAPTSSPSLISLPLFLFLLSMGAVGSVAWGTFHFRNRAEYKGRLPFDKLFQLAGGEFPARSTVLVQGSFDKEATTLALQLARRHLSQGKSCLLIAYGSPPSTLVYKAGKYGWKPRSYIEDGKLGVIDCYHHGEDAEVKNPMDLGEVGVKVAGVMEKLEGSKPKMLVIDSFTNTFRSTPYRKVLGFISLLAEKVKSEDGIVMIAVEKRAVPGEALAPLEALANGIIELNGTGKARTLEVRKTFGRQVKPLPVEYNVRRDHGF